MSSAEEALAQTKKAPAWPRSWLLAAALPPLITILAFVSVVYAPTLNDFFIGDDFLDLADMAHKSTGQFLKDAFTLQGDIPFWRFLTRVVTLAEYRLFGLNAIPYHFLNLGMHLAIVLLAFGLGRALTKRNDVALLAALLFGVTPAHVVTVAWPTALNRLLCTFFFLVSLLALHYYLEVRHRKGEAAPASLPQSIQGGLYSISVVAFLLAILSDEVAATLSLLLAFYLWLFLPGGRSRTRFLEMARLAAPYLLLSAVAAIFLYTLQIGGTYLKPADYGFGSHVFRNFWEYLARLVYPVGADAPEKFWPVHRVAGALVAVGLAWAFWRGSAVTRFLTAGVVIALVPYLPWVHWVVSRYTYLATIFFAVLAAQVGLALYERLRARSAWAASRLAPGGLALLLLFFVHQTLTQNGGQALAASHYETLVNELRREMPTLPPGSQVYILNGIWNDRWDPIWLPAIGKLLYGDARIVNVKALDCAGLTLTPPAFVFRYQNGHLVRPPSSAGCPGG